MTDDPKPPPALGLAVPLTEAVIASFERLARGEPTEDLVKALVAEVRRLHQLVLDAAKLLEHSKPTGEAARRAYVAIKAEVDR